LPGEAVDDDVHGGDIAILCKKILKLALGSVVIHVTDINFLGHFGKTSNLGLVLSTSTGLIRLGRIGSDNLEAQYRADSLQRRN
jgi:hypothetical protein